MIGILYNTISRASTRTGHEKRFNRKELIDHDGIGGYNYSKEELTAELIAAFLSGFTGIEKETITNSAPIFKAG